MCGRFTTSFEFREIKLLFKLQRDIPLFARQYNIAPSQEVTVIVQKDGVNELKADEVGLGSGMGAGSIDR
jgi:putative SOS response-associated peptidase YedK